jgi:hypothetical protein
VPVDEGRIENAALQGVRFLDGLRSVRAVKFAAAVVLAVERNPAVQIATARLFTNLTRSPRLYRKPSDLGSV